MVSLLYSGVGDFPPVLERQRTVMVSRQMSSLNKVDIDFPVLKKASYVTLNLIFESRPRITLSTTKSSSGNGLAPSSVLSQSQPLATNPSDTLRARLLAAMTSLDLAKLRPYITQTPERATLTNTKMDAAMIVSNRLWPGCVRERCVTPWPALRPTACFPPRNRNRRLLLLFQMFRLFQTFRSSQMLRLLPLVFHRL